MRLNLPKYQCVKFELFSDFTVPLAKDTQIDLLMDATHTHELDDRTQKIALFGSKSKTGGINHIVRGRLAKTARQNDLAISLSVSSSRSHDNLSPPPRSFRPVSQLIQASATLFGSIDVSCHANFEYDLGQGHKSKISFPIPLLVPDEGTGFTHVESAQFSRRINDKVEYQVVVEQLEDPDLFIHFCQL